MAGSAGKLWSPPRHDQQSSLTGCRKPSGCLHAADWKGHPMGCAASLEHPPALVYLKGGEKGTADAALFILSERTVIDFSRSASTNKKSLFSMNNRGLDSLLIVATELLWWFI